MESLENRSITLPCGPNSGDRTFDGLAALEEWVNQEKAYWAWLHTERELRGTQHRDTAGIYQNSLKMIENHVAQLKARVGEESQFEATLSALREELLSQRKQKIVRSDDAKAEFLANLRESRGPKVASWALRHFLYKNIDLHTEPQAIEGTLRAALFSFGIDKTAESERAALEHLIDRWNTEFEQYSDNVRGVLSDLSRERDNSGEVLAEAQKQLNQVFDDARSELEDISATYDKKLALHSAVKYWSHRSVFHYIASVLVILIAGGAGIGLFEFSNEFIPGQFSVPEDALLPSNYIIVGLLITLSIWALRILVRVFLGQLHLGTDARERATMVQAYLSLLREGGGLTENDKGLIIQAMFRPSGVNYGQGDGAPQTPQSIVGKWVSGKS